MVIIVLTLGMGFLGCLCTWGTWLGYREGWRDGYDSGYHDRDMETLCGEEPGARRHDTR